MENILLKHKKNNESESALEENERHANIVTAIIMINFFFAQIIICILTLLDVLILEKNMAILFMAIGVIFLLIPSIICLKIKGKGYYTKHILLFLLTTSLAMINALFTYTSIVILVIPIILAARYYSRKFIIYVAILTTIMYGISAYLGTYIGFTDLNYIKLPKGTTVMIETTLEDAIDNLSLNQQQIIKSIMFESFVPKLLIYLIVIVAACVHVSQSGKKMINRQKELSEEGARIESELNIAKSIQKNMLPSKFPIFPEYKEFDIYASMKPAKEVGGDFYDMFLTDENHLAMVIADVSGKGVPAALIMMTARTLIKNTALNGYSADEVYNKVNQMLCEGNNSNHFVTSWFGILDIRNGKLEFVNAGHNPPLLYSKEKNTFEYLKTKPNLILAAMDDTKYMKHEINLEIGDKLFLYTDGVTEAQNENDELYGEKRLQDYLNNHIEQDVENTIKGVKDDIDNFAQKAKQFDDITMLEFLFKEKKGENK